MVISKIKLLKTQIVANANDNDMYSFISLGFENICLWKINYQKKIFTKEVLNLGEEARN